jgi:hypothetical protein
MNSLAAIFPPADSSKLPVCLLLLLTSVSAEKSQQSGKS